MLNRFVIGGLLVALLSVGAYWLGGDYMRLRREHAQLTQKVAEQEKVLEWLKEPILQAGGKTYSRAQLIDLVLKVALDGKQ